jgi:type VI secretion system protein ImpH
MNASLATPTSDIDPESIAARLTAEPFAFDFFQAMRVLEKMFPDRLPVGRSGPLNREVVRLHAHLSLSFPPSSIYELAIPEIKDKAPDLVVTFLGLTGPSGVLPRHYTELLLRLERDAKGPEKRALSDWLDLFNHRFISLFYRAWEKYRFTIAYERGSCTRIEPDPFTRALYSLIGLGVPALRHRLKVARHLDVEDPVKEELFARIDDLALLYYSGLLAHRPRNAAGLEAILCDYFQLPVRVLLFQGQWLRLEPESQSRLGDAGIGNQLGLNLVAGERVWDVQGKFRIQVGPLRYEEFIDLLPDRRAGSERKTFFLLSHLIRLYAGIEFDFDVQLILKAKHVPACRFSEEGLGARLGWNTWIHSEPATQDAEDSLFGGQELVWI